MTVGKLREKLDEWDEGREVNILITIQGGRDTVSSDIVSVEDVTGDVWLNGDDGS